MNEAVTFRGPNVDVIHYIGVDSGGTTLVAAAVDTASGKMLGRHEVPTLGREGPEAVMARMAELIETVVAAAGVAR
jgi:glucokinase